MKESREMTDIVNGKVAAITEAASGIGLARAR
jgi:NADP-dependent 3-hydroxy acid dehydrogenase YdfG